MARARGHLSTLLNLHVHLVVLDNQASFNMFRYTLSSSFARNCNFLLSTDLRGSLAKCSGNIAICNQRNLIICTSFSEKWYIRCHKNKTSNSNIQWNRCVHLSGTISSLTLGCNNKKGVNQVTNIELICTRRPSTRKFHRHRVLFCEYQDKKDGKENQTQGLKNDGNEEVRETVSKFIDKNILVCIYSYR